MNDLSVFVVEDDELTAQALKMELDERFPGIEVIVENAFDNALSILSRQGIYEILILDLYEGVRERENLTGQGIWELIWRNRFIPIVIFTAGEVELEPEPPEDNPFIKVIQKGVGGAVAVAEYIESIEPYVYALRDVQDEVNFAVQTVLKKSSPQIWNLVGEDIEKRSTILVRSTRRRLAALMDMNTLLGEDTLKVWEQYVFPPLENNFLTGDILFVQGEDKNDPSSFLLMLSPSCDLVIQSSGTSKLEKALVAKCESLKRYVQSASSTGGIQKDKLPERLPRFLNEPHVGGYIPLPAMEGIIPPMAANLRDLDLIDIEDITSEDEDGQSYLRLASIDSPFREQIVWAFLSIYGRPGVPQRDLSEWTEEIISVIDD